LNPSNRPALFMLMGPLSLAPLIGVSDSLVKSVGFLLVLGSVGLLYFVLMKTVAPLLRSTTRLLIGATIAATLVTIAGLLLQAHALELYQALGIYLPLIGVQCLLLSGADTDQHGGARGLLRLSGYYGATFMLLGAVRELLGQASLLSNAQWLFGSNASRWQIDLFASASGLHLAVLAPGGFILLGLVLAVANALRLRRKDTSI
jgi:electron transport complex protein RnfE